MLTGAARRLFGRGGRSLLRKALQEVAERKYLDVTQTNIFGGTPLYYTGLVYPMADITQGYTSNQRIGDKCTLTSLQLKIYVRPPYFTGNFQRDMILRIIIFSWKDDTVPGVFDILQPPSNTIDVNYNCLKPLNSERKVMRKLWYDKTFTFFDDTQAAGVSAPDGASRVMNIFIPVKKMNVISFSANASTVGTNKLYILMINNVTDINPGIRPWDVRFSSRANFVDL